MPWPLEIRLKKSANTLHISYDDGREFTYAAAALRRASPSAETRGHGSGPAPVINVSPDIRITGVEPIGNYAIRILFSDGHDTGFYSWDHLYKLGAQD
jgi:DUF971 family protein